MKGREEKKNVRDGKEEEEKSNIPGIQKRSKKNEDTIKPDLIVTMKAARIERQRVKIFKLQLLSEKKCAEKR